MLPLLLTAAICNAQNSGTERSISVEHTKTARILAGPVDRQLDRVGDGNGPGPAAVLHRRGLGAVDQPSIWGSFVGHSSRIDFYLPDADRVWGADDDIDIECVLASN